MLNPSYNIQLITVRAIEFGRGEELLERICNDTCSLIIQIKAADKGLTSHS